eukprot:782950-Rhodomonas_salina.1
MALSSSEMRDARSRSVAENSSVSDGVVVSAAGSGSVRPPGESARRVSESESVSDSERPCTGLSSPLEDSESYSSGSDCVATPGVSGSSSGCVHSMTPPFMT